jgi:iron complex outermembrane receptor protein
MLFRSGLDVVVDRDGALALVPCRHWAPAAEVQDTGAITGRVTEKVTGVALYGATVALDGTGRSTTTDSDGRFRIGGLPAGTYTVRARYVGYTPLVAVATVSVDGETPMDFAMEKSAQVLEELVTVTPGGMQTQLRALPTPLSVITAEEIGRQQPRTLPQLLRQAVPGMVAMDLTARPEQARFSVRGASTLNPGDNQMKVFVDGIQLAVPAQTQLDPNSIERVEVIRGPQAAAVYGSDATGGVIQIFTKRGDTTLQVPQVSAEVGAGIVQTPYKGFGAVARQTYSAAVSGGGSDVSYSVGGGYTRTADWLPDDEISRQATRHADAGIRFARGLIEIDVSGRYGLVDAPGVVNPDLLDTGFPPFAVPQFTTGSNLNQSIGARLSLAPASWWQHNLTLGIDNFESESAQDRIRLTTPDDTLLTLSLFTARRNWIGYNTAVRGPIGRGLTGSVQAGLDYNERLTSSSSSSRARVDAERGLTPGADGTRLVADNTGLFGQGELAIRDKVFLTAGLRAEWNAGFGDSLGTPLSPRVGGSWVEEIGEATIKLRASWGRAILAPSPSNRLAFGTLQLANPELGPEEQRGWDAGVDLNLGRQASLSATYFDQTAENLIQFVQIQVTPTPLFQWQNVGRVKNRGVELAASTRLPGLHVNANYAYTRARIDRLPRNYTGTLRAGDQVPITPKHTAGATLTADPLTGLAVSAGIAYIGSSEETDVVAQFRCLGGTGPCPPDFDFTVRYPGFVKLNLTVSQRLTRQLLGFLQVDNLTNSTAFEFNNVLPVMGRITTVGLRFRS